MWDFATLELGVNMRGRFDAKEYEQRVRYFLNTILEKNSDRPVVVIGIYPNGAEFSLRPENSITKSNIEFNQITERIVAEKNERNIHFISGKDILTDFTGLSIDLLHPSDDGHIIMGENLSKHLRKLLKDFLISYSI